jgi:tyrosyl-tRNA synthetase
VRLIFGDKEAEQAEKITRILFGWGKPVELIKSDMDSDDLQALYQATGWATIQSLPARVIDLCTESWLTASNNEAKKQIKAGAIYINEKKVTDMGQEINKDDLLHDKVVLLRKGKKNYKTAIFN